MPRIISNLELLQEYVRGVLDRADHHAPNVDQVCLTIAGAILWVSDEDPEVFTRDGEMKNVLWMRVNNQRYAISYNHEDQCIDVRENTVQGRALAKFTNASSAGEVKRFFGGLRG